jgi:hypothetical protein
MAAIQQITVATRTASQVKATMAVLDPSFDKANYGRGSVRDFLTRLDHRVRTAGRSGGDIILALIDTATNWTRRLFKEGVLRVLGGGLVTWSRVDSASRTSPDGGVI